MTLATHASKSARRAAPTPAAAELAAALRRETDLVRSLRDALMEQRGAVARGEAERVNASVDAIGRLLHTLGEARGQRVALMEAWAGGIPSEPAAGCPAGPVAASELDLARRELRRAATEVAHETAINRAVLRRAVENGEAFLQALFSAVAAPPAVYAPAERPDDAGGAGVLLDRQA